MQIKKKGLIVKNKEDLIMSSLNNKEGFIVKYNDLVKRG